MWYNNKVLIDVHLVCQLIATQFPHWADLPIKPVKQGGWDNRTFHLGESMTVRLPSGEEYAPQVEKEQHWLSQNLRHFYLFLFLPLWQWASQLNPIPGPGLCTNG